MTYDGPLALSGSPAEVGRQAHALFADVSNRGLHRRSGTTRIAALEMFAEIDLATRAALGVFADLSLTARNEAEGQLMLAYQKRPADAHLRPTATPAEVYGDIWNEVEQTFNNAASGDGPVQFVGPDGAIYDDADGMLGRYADQNPMEDAAVVLETIDLWMARVAADLAAEKPSWTAEFKARFGDWTDALIAEIEGLFSATAAVLRGGSFAGVGDLEAIAVLQGPSSVPKGAKGGLGKGSQNKDSATVRDTRHKLEQRSGAVAATQLNAKFIGKARTVLKLMGARVRFDFEHIRTRPTKTDNQGRTIYPRKNGISGSHDRAEMLRQIEYEGGRITKEESHPTMRGVSRIYYEIGVLKPQTDHHGPNRQFVPGQYKSGFEPKTVYDSSVISHQDMARMGRQAFRNSLIRHTGTPPKKWQGRAANGIEFEGRWNADNRIVNTFYVAPW
ncbi:CdiA family toxin C-terminal domain-containing protein [Aestuariibius sp. 2305UL40-4]|uniref:CdiA family toxin C-terminal domain-containing protein n=1 Tax=Aestuariibius violaceus TaxID=3234132 RepID=UPI00398E6CEF